MKDRSIISWNKMATVYKYRIANMNWVHSKNNTCHLCFILFCCELVLDNLIHIHQGDFKALGQSYECPSANEATLKNMDKRIRLIHYERMI